MLPPVEVAVILVAEIELTFKSTSLIETVEPSFEKVLSSEFVLEVKLEPVITNV